MGVNNLGYEDRAGNPNSVAGTDEEIEMVSVGFCNRHYNIT